MREGFNAVKDAFADGKISESRIDESLRRIAHLKSLIESPLPFDTERLQFLSDKISQFNKLTEDKQFA